MTEISVNDLLRKFAVGSKWRLVVTCVGSAYGMKKGDTYTQDLIVHSVKRIRRQWEEPGKEVVFRVTGKLSGYNSLMTSWIFKVKDFGEFIRIEHKEGRGIRNDYYPVVGDQ